MAVRPDSTMGYRTAAKVMVIFMFAFYFLGYTPFLSICLAAIAAVTSGFISSWWHAKEDYITDEATGAQIVDGEPTETGSRSRGIRYGFGIRTARNQDSSVARPARGVGWLFRRNRS